MIIVLAVDLGWLPTGGYVAFTDSPLGWLATSTMPAIWLALLLAGSAGAHHALHHAGGAAAGLHPHRAGQGAAEGVVVVKHALANALIPIMTVVASLSAC